MLKLVNAIFQKYRLFAIDKCVKILMILKLTYGFGNVIKNAVYLNILIFLQSILHRGVKLLGFRYQANLHE